MKLQDTQEGARNARRQTATGGGKTSETDVAQRRGGGENQYERVEKTRDEMVSHELHNRTRWQGSQGSDEPRSKSNVVS